MNEIDDIHRAYKREIAALRRRLSELEMSDQQTEKQMRLASFPEQNPDPIIEIHIERGISYINPVAREHFPDLEDLAQQHPMLAGLDLVVQSLRRDGEEAYSREVEIGDRIYEQKITHVPHNDIVRIYAHDITELKRVTEAIRQNEMRFHRIFEYTNDAIFLIDLTDERILDANSKACHLLGYERGELLALPISEVHPYELEQVRQFAQKVQKENHGWTDQLSCVTQSGQLVPAEISASIVDIDGRQCLISVVRDLTERERTIQVLTDEVLSRYNYEEIVGRSESLQGVLNQVDLVAPTASTVLILGETGTGKELICRAIHHNSLRQSQPLVKLNCAAIPSGLIESELFGHEKGAFTGAITQKRGRFELAHGGSIFLDEIGDIPLETQPKLLRLLQEREFERVGGSTTIEVDVRVIAATHRNLEDMVQKNEFREDLFYRLNVFPMQLPPLRERSGDIVLLAGYFAQRVCSRLGRPPCRFSESAMQRLIEYNWPGNVRELENIVERAVILCAGGMIEGEHVHVRSEVNKGAEKGIRSLQEMEKEHILSALRAAKGKISGKGGAAEMLGLKPSTLDSRMKKLGVRYQPE